MKVICTRCGGTNIACEAIVNPNTGKIIDYLDESFMHANCGDCKEEVVITDVDRVKKDIDSMFFEFVKKNGKEWSCHYQIYGRDIQDVMGGVTGGAGVYG